MGNQSPRSNSFSTMAETRTKQFGQDLQQKAQQFQKKISESIKKKKEDTKEEVKRPGGQRNVHRGIQIENDPLEREIYVKCPSCRNKVFDSGLENEIVCENCGVQFISGKEYSHQQVLILRQRAEEEAQDSDEEDEGEGAEQEQAQEDADSDEQEQNQDENPFGSASQEEPTLHTVAIQDIFYHGGEEEEKKEQTSPMKVKRSPTSAVKSDKKASFQTPIQIKRADIKMAASGQQRNSNLGSANSKAGSNQSSGSHSQTQQRRSLTGANTDSSSKYVNELEDVVLFCNKDTIFSDFKDNSSQGINLTLIQNSLLMPFFQIRARILEKGSYFKIGDIEFYCAACEPHEFGKVTSKTIIRCTYAVSKQDELQRINLVPIRRLDNSRQVILETAIRPFLDSHPEFYVHKNQILEFEDYEFYVKYSRPFFGRMMPATEIKIDSSTTKAVQILRIAPIWETDQKQEEASQKKAQVFESLKNTYLNPYFFCGFMCFVEKGETILIDNQEFFVNDCRPKQGIVDKQTIIELEVGFTQEVFKKKQVLADQRFAEKIQTRDVSNNFSSGSRHRPFRLEGIEGLEEMMAYGGSMEEAQNLMELFNGSRRSMGTGLGVQGEDRSGNNPFESSTQYQDTHEHEDGTER